jgi:hypothetical protein
MFTKIVVALNDLPESQRALRTAIELARASNAELATVSILGDLPVYTSFVIVVDPSAPNTMEKERRRAHKEEHADLLIIGLHQHDFYLSRLWSSVYDLAQDAPCSVLGVH